MKIIKKILREPLFYLLPLLALAGFWTIPKSPSISNVILTADGKASAESFPLSTHRIREYSNFSISFDLNIKSSKKFIYNFYPDDCILSIEINGKTFPQERIKRACDYNNGTVLDFSDFLQNGLNKIEFQMKNHGGPGGLRIETPYKGFKSLSLIHYVFTLLLLISIALILKKFKFRFIAISIILLGITVRLILYTYTGPMQNTYDIDRHLHYIQIIAEEKRLPKGGECWSCFQPPLYYIASAAVKNIVDSFSPSLTNRILQQNSLLLSFGCVILGVALIINLLGNGRVAYSAALVFVLWPGFVLAAPRISNDIPFYFGSLFCMLFAQKYWQTRKNSDMLLASIGASIALAAKSNGFIILGAWVIIYILKVAHSLKIGSLRVLLASIFIIALSIGFSNHRAIVDVFDKKKVELLGPVNMNGDGLRVQNTAGNYLYFDLRDYLFEPYTSAWTNNGGRQYFWNYALKTSLFGEFRLWNTHTGHTFATMLSIFALLIFAFALWGIIHVKIKEFPMMLFAVFLFAALISYRVAYPFSCNNDFRFIFPVLLPVVYFSVRGVQVMQNLRLKILSYAALLAFAILSFLFTVVQAF
ncbi:MAG: hypothetical protein LBC85_00475 [Fibromonadaceae bacterium]|jgi:hypothetical protein|nr:hypothetical protein [Fibromonadaceae bacterium]